MILLLVQRRSDTVTLKSNSGIVWYVNPRAQMKLVTLSGIELILIISNDDKNNITRHSSARKGIMNTVPEMHEMDSRIIDATYLCGHRTSRYRYRYRSLKEQSDAFRPLNYPKLQNKYLDFFTRDFLEFFSEVNLPAYWQRQYL
jgi:hypothetical protein